MEDGNPKPYVEPKTAPTVRGTLNAAGAICGFLMLLGILIRVLVRVFD